MSPSRMYRVRCLLDGKSFEFPVYANSAADAISIAKATYGPRLMVFGATSTT